jgi:hypothetical protein
MKCADYKNMIPEYISGELEKSDITGLEKHISDCADCRKHLEAEKYILSQISDDELEVPAGLNRTVLSKIRPAGNIFSTHRFFYTSAAAVILLIISITIVRTFLLYDSLDLIAEKNTQLKDSLAALRNSNEYYYASAGVFGDGYDELSSYDSELYSSDKWTSEDAGIFQSDNDLINDILTLEELESYDDLLSSL